MQYARDNLDLDPHWHHCPACDLDYDAKPGAHGLCPDCEKKRQAVEAADEEYA